uniref:Uncharacterized protein n=1 Tax=Anguilla anguilla TaxID=7936 RepID=A0A0E9WHA1_ANGAN
MDIFSPFCCASLKSASFKACVNVSCKGIHFKPRLTSHKNVSTAETVIFCILMFTAQKIILPFQPKSPASQTYLPTVDSANGQLSGMQSVLQSVLPV